jgi:NTE family protein
MGNVGLALSGGGARGIAHLGIIKAFNEMGVTFDEVSGTSFGAIAGAFYASGVRPEEVLEIVTKTKLILFVRPAISKTGLLKVGKLSDLFSKYLPVEKFEELNQKLTVNATDIKAGTIKYFDQGPMIPAILASCCMPVIFDPMMINGTAYIDGGILNNLPVEPLQAGCDVIIGSHCNPVQPDFKVKNAKALLERTLLMAIRNNTLQRREFCQVFLEPAALGSYIGSDFDKAREMFEIGYDHIMGKRKQIEAALS